MIYGLVALCFDTVDFLCTNRYWWIGFLASVGLYCMVAGGALTVQQPVLLATGITVISLGVGLVVAAFSCMTKDV